MSKPMNLNFTLYEVAAVLIAATVTRTFTYDGESHWFEGSMLVGIYLILGLGFYHLS
jgi:Ca2+:H+ antiporter